MRRTGPLPRPTWRTSASRRCSKWECQELGWESFHILSMFCLCVCVSDNEWNGEDQECIDTFSDVQPQKFQSYGRTKLVHPTSKPTPGKLSAKSFDYDEIVCNFLEILRALGNSTRPHHLADGVLNPQTTSARSFGESSSWHSFWQLWRAPSIPGRSLSAEVLPP